MELKLLFLVAINVLVLLTPECQGWRRRRRRRCGRVNCAVSGWSAWSACSSACGSTGFQYRTRTVTRGPACGGAGCPSLKETRACNRHCGNGGTPLPNRCACKHHFRGRCCEIADGNWSKWSPWASCSRTCGTSQRRRMRFCNNPAPLNGRKCLGINQEVKSCFLKHCPVHGGWSPWGAWGICSKTCGTGVQTRQRQCNNPTPAYGGRVCLPVPVQKRVCKGSACLFIKGVGCYRGTWKKLLRDFKQEIDWTDLSKIVIKCALLAKKDGYRFFAVEYYSKCVTDSSKRYDYATIPMSTNCFDKVGMDGAMYIYIVR